MTDPITRVEVLVAQAQYLASSDEEDYARLGEHVPRLAATLLDAHGALKEAHRSLEICAKHRSVDKCDCWTAKFLRKFEDSQQ